MKFEIKQRDKSARTGVLTIANKTVQTPTFMPVGTYGTVKAMSPQSLYSVGAEIILGNTFHLWLLPMRLCYFPRLFHMEPFFYLL